MSSEVTSTIAFNSNLQVITSDSIRSDKFFLGCVRDFKGLEYMRKKGIWLNRIQQIEFDRAALHCTYAFPDDYPFGTIIAENGTQKVVCKCINTACAHFQQCRPDFDPAEIDVLNENEMAKKSIAIAMEKIRPEKTPSTTSTGDEDAAVQIWGKSKPAKREDKPDVGTLTTDSLVEEFVEDTAAETTAPSENTATHIPEVVDFSAFIPVEQDDIIHLPSDARTVVNAGPGTGKTWTLIEKIKYMLNDLEADPEGILVLCFSKAAVEVVRSRLSSAAECGELPITWQMVDVRTFDSFCTFIIYWVQENMPELLPDWYSIENENYDQRIRTASKIMTQCPDIVAQFEHIIVDEVQDLVGNRAELVLSLLEILPETCGFTVLGDSCQSIYDYLAENDSSVMPSTKFYSQLFTRFNEANYFSLETNHRQGDKLSAVSIPYREAILSGSAEMRTDAAQKLYDSIEESSVDLKHFGKQDARQYTRKGTLGILTRTNAQALQISAWLRNEGISHKLEQPVTNRELDGWIGRVLLNAQTDVIDRQEFLEIFQRLFPSVSTEAGCFWDALVSTQQDQTRTHFEISNLLQGILQDGRDPLLYEDPDTVVPAITVSNIHRAKGKEFDSVLVLEDVISSMIKEDDVSDLEHRVCYVAVTRPRAKLEMVPWKTQYIYLSHDEQRRCFKAGGFRARKYLSHYEVGDASDFDPRFYASSEELQFLFQNKLEVGTRLKLLKSSGEAHGWVKYHLVLEENENQIVATTTPDFSLGMEKAIQRIYGNNRSIDPKYFPNIFTDIYVDGLTTCISSRGDNIPGAKKFGNMYLWTGLAVSGFAQMEKDRY